MAFCFSAFSTSVCSWAAVYGNGLCSKITKQTNNIAIEVTKHCLELRAREVALGLLVKLRSRSLPEMIPYRISFSEGQRTPLPGKRLPTRESGRRSKVI